jgi:hypothetical protein
MIQLLFSSIEPIYFVLAYAGMILHILLKVADLNQNPYFKLKNYIKKNIYTIVATLIMIPIMLIILTDTTLSDILPINKVTAVLAGYQTQSIFKTIMNMFSSRIKTTEI